ncbi:spore coat protein CotJB [Neobacillus mesonae]|nr:spore coat protein CotJB [Neobacillus mesonae]
MNNPIDENYYKLLHELQALDFVLVELTLYLDTHPDDPAALEQFNLYARTRRDLADQFEALYGPLLQFGQSGAQQPYYQWSKSPWPWQV